MTCLSVERPSRRSSGPSRGRRCLALEGSVLPSRLELRRASVERRRGRVSSLRMSDRTFTSRRASRNRRQVQPGTGGLCLLLSRLLAPSTATGHGVSRFPLEKRRITLRRTWMEGRRSGRVCERGSGRPRVCRAPTVARPSPTSERERTIRLRRVRVRVRQDRKTTRERSRGRARG